MRPAHEGRAYASSAGSTIRFTRHPDVRVLLAAAVRQIGAPTRIVAKYCFDSPASFRARMRGKEDVSFALLARLRVHPQIDRDSPLARALLAACWLHCSRCELLPELCPPRRVRTYRGQLRRFVRRHRRGAAKT